MTDTPEQVGWPLNTGVAADAARAATASRPSPSVSGIAGIANADAWPVWEVGLYGFGDIYVEAPTEASARWFAASKCHEAGYGRSPVDLIQRGVDVREVDPMFAGIMGAIHRVKHLARKGGG